MWDGCRRHGGGKVDGSLMELFVVGVEESVGLVGA